MKSTQILCDMEHEQDEEAATQHFSVAGRWFKADLCPSHTAQLGRLSSELSGLLELARPVRKPKETSDQKAPV